MSSKTRNFKGLKTSVLIVVFTVIYFYLGEFGLSLAFMNASASAFWPPTGIALAVLLIWGYRLWPGIFIGAFLVNLNTQHSWGTALCIATGNTLETLVAMGLVRRWANGLNCFERVRMTVVFIFLTAVFSTMVSATIGTITLIMGNYAGWNQCWMVWQTWWVGDMTSDLVFTPLLLIWITKPFPRWNANQLLEGAGLLAILCLVGKVVFWGGYPFVHFLAPEQLDYLAIPPLLWAAMRFGPHGAVLSTFVITWIALLGTLHMMGPFVVPDRNLSILLLQACIGTISITSLVVAVVIFERKRFQWRLQVKDAISRTLAEAQSLGEAARKILQVLCEMAGWEMGAMWQIDQKTNKLVCFELWQMTSLNISEFETITRESRFDLGIGLPGRVWLGGKPVWVADVTRDDNFPRAPAALKAGLHTAFCFPIKLGDKILGVVECFQRKCREVDDDFIQMLVPLGSQIGQFFERKRAEASLRENEARLRLINEQVPAIIWTVDRNFKFTSATGLSSDDVNMKPHELVGRSLCEVYRTTDENYPGLVAHRRALNGERSMVELQFEDRYWRCNIEPLMDGGGSIIGCIGVAMNITEAKKTETRLQELAAIVQSSEDAIVSITPEAIIISWNKGAERLLGYAAGEMIGKNISAIFPPEQFERAEQTIRRVMQGESVESYETLRHHKDGTSRAVSVKVSAVTDPAGKIISLAAIYRDITKQKQLERTVLEISANEQRRIGHDLHDGLGQHLAGIAFKAKALEESLAGKSPVLADEAGEIVNLVNEGIKQTRSLASGLDPVDIEVAGLPAALQKLAAKTAEHFHLACDFRCGQERLTADKQTSLALYRIAQEGIHNAIEHGKARYILIDLSIDNRKLSLKIHDNGNGFRLKDGHRSGMGMRIMHYRANSIGGSLTIQSQLNAGTDLVCVVPV
jgi:PAS domain S-box-containing protein